MNLADEIAQMQQEMMQDIPESVLQSLQEENMRLLAKNPEAQALNEGEMIPHIR